MPRRKNLALWAVLATVAAAAAAGRAAQADYAALGRAALEWTRKIVELGPRPPGSEAHERLQELILGELRERGAGVERRAFTASTPKGEIPMANLIGRFEGTTGRAIAVSGHYDTYSRPSLRFVGANDGGSSTAFLLALARLLENRRLNHSVWLVFFDGEESIVEWKNRDHTYGSRRLAGDWKQAGVLEDIRALINVDMIGDAGLSLVHEQNSTEWLRELVWETAHRLGYEREFPFERWGYIEDDHLPFVKAGVPAVNLIDFEYGPANRYWHSEQDTVDKLSAESFAVVLHVVAETLAELGAFDDSSAR